MTTRTRPRPLMTGRRRRRRRQWWTLVLAVLTVVAVAGGALALAADRADRGDPVDEFTDVTGLAIPAWAPESIYLSTRDGLMHLDGREEWRRPDQTRAALTGLVADPSDPGVLYAGRAPSAGTNGLVVSRDGGRTWRVTAGGPTHVEALAAARGEEAAFYGWEAGEPPALRRSVDGGRSWEVVPARDLVEAGGVASLAVHPDDSDELLAATPAGLHRSVDGGQTWDAVLDDAPVTAVAYAGADGARALAYADDPDRGLLVSENAGASWTPVGLTPGDVVTSIAVHPDRDETVVVATAGGDVLRTTDEGRSWDQLAEAGVPNLP